MPRSFKFGGTIDDPLGTELVYLGDQSTYGLSVNIGRWDWINGVGLNVQEVAFGFGHGSWGNKYPPRLITLPCFVQGSSWADTRGKLDAINYLLDKSQLRSIVLDDIPDRFWMVRRSGAPAVNVYQTGASFALEFVAPDPRAYALSEVSRTVSLAAGSNSITQPAIGTVGGTAEADVVYILKPTGAGATNPMIENTTRDEALTWTGTLGANEWLRITAGSRVRLVEKSTDSGASWTDSMAAVSGRFPRLSPQVANALTVSGLSGTGTIEITYRERYL